MRILPIDDLDQLLGYGEAWEALCRRVTDSSSVFLSPQWINNWWNCFGNGARLSTMLLYEGDRLVGFAPLSVEVNRSLGFPIRVLRFVGTRHADHMDFCIEAPWRRKALEKIMAHIADLPGWDVMDLIDIPEDSQNVSILLDLFARHNIPYDAQPSIICPYLSINGDQWDTFYAGKRSKSGRQDLRRRFRRLGDLGNAEFKKYDDPESVNQVFPQLLKVYDKRWDNKNLSLSFTGEKERDFYRNVITDFARHGQLHLLTLELDGEVIAFTVSAIKDTQFTWLLTAFDPEFNKYFPGELILTRLLEDAFEGNTFREFDFTRGEEAYKFKWTDQKRWNLRIIARNRGLFRRLPYEAIRLYATVRREAKKSEFIRNIKLNGMGHVYRAVGLSKSWHRG